MCACGQFHGLDAHCRSSRRTNVFLVESYAIAFAGRHDKLVVAVGEDGFDEFVVFRKLDCDFAVTFDGREFFERSFLDESVFGCKHEEVTFSFLGQRKHCLNLFARYELQQIDDCATAGRLACLGDFVSFHREHFAEVREEHEVLMRVADENVFDKVVVLRLVRRNAHSAASLRTVFGNGQTFDVAAVSHRHDDVFLVDKVGNVDFGIVVAEFGTSGGTVLLFNFGKFGNDDFLDCFFGT